MRKKKSLIQKYDDNFGFIVAILLLAIAVVTVVKMIGQKMKRIKRKREETEVDRLEKISIKEISSKYPDKVVGVIDRRNDSILILDTCKIIFKK